MGRPDHSGAATLLLDNHRATSSRNSKNPVHAVYGVQRASSASRATAHHATGSPARQARRKWHSLKIVESRLDISSIQQPVGLSKGVMQGSDEHLFAI